jgi:adenylate kinase
MKKNHREVIVFLGKPGSGKGTQSEPLARALGIPAVSVGKMIREEIKKGTPIGKRIAAIVAAGKLISVSDWAALIKKRLRSPDVRQGIIIDGSPRDFGQALIMDKICRVTHAILVSITDKEVIRRISGRRVCSKCGQNYHIESFKPKRPGICDKCGGRILHRDDDKPSVIKERLKSYREDTIPVLRFYRRQRVLRRIDGQGPIEEVGKNILEAIKRADRL